MSDTAGHTKGLRGVHVLFMVAAFFGFLIIANAFFIAKAVQSHRGEDVPKSYLQGVNYNETLAERSAQAAMNWTAEVGSGDGVVWVFIDDAEERPISGLALEATLRHPADQKRDMPVEFTEVEPGRYDAPLPELTGRWSLRLTAVDAPFTLHTEMIF